jgi:hypothetical protein
LLTTSLLMEPVIFIDAISNEIAHRCLADTNHLCVNFQLIICEKKDSLLLAKRNRWV